MNDDTIDLVKKLLVRNPEERLGAGSDNDYNKLKSHSFFKGIEWDNLFTQNAPEFAIKKL